MLCAKDLRVRLGLDADDSSMDALIETLLTEAAEYGLAYCHLRAGEVLPDYLLSQMVCEDFGRTEGAGVISRSVSGASEKYRGSYSDGILAALRALRHPGGRCGGC